MCSLRLTTICILSVCCVATSLFIVDAFRLFGCRRVEGLGDIGGKTASSARPGGDAASPEVSLQRYVELIPVDTRRAVAGQLIGMTMAFSVIALLAAIGAGC
jgi:hypothetical protein